MTVVVHKEGLNLGTIQKELFGYSVHFNTFDENGQLNKYKTNAMSEDMILKDWRYATDEEVTQFNVGKKYSEF